MKQKKQLDTPQARRAEKRRRLRRRRMIRLATVLIVTVLILAAIVWGVIEIAKASKGEAATFFGVKDIEVEFVNGEGTVRYSKEDIIRASGIFVNQSLLAVNKVQASDSVLKEFPYLDYVEVKNTSFSTVCIRVAEVEVLAAVRAKKDWLIVGRNNHVLEKVTTKKLPKDVIRVIGAKALSEKTGEDALDERDIRICMTLVDAVEVNNVKDITVIDISEKTNLHLWWKDQVDIVLGNESNLAVQVSAFKRLLPTLLEKNGSSVAGQLDMSSYADDKTDNDRAVFTPEDSLKKPEDDEEKSEETKPSESKPTQSTTAA